ncbi:MAG: Site-specific DNA-methyltransferase (adenine-specific), partial [Armatimonadetes bacterium]|nr:Site-specific DNA-methyltransferase (adenine-specific) [Armatimonadota bacterium]
ILGRKAFPQPKPVALVRYLLSMVRDPEAIVLDCFAGSGTTGHAVLDLNRIDGGSRRFLLVELEPEICREITAERLRRVIQGYSHTERSGMEQQVEGLGGGFRYCMLGSPAEE